jgi:Winged helix-turn-helix DNA-binding
MSILDKLFGRDEAEEAPEQVTAEVEAVVVEAPAEITPESPASSPEPVVTPELLKQPEPTPAPAPEPAPEAIPTVAPITSEAVLEVVVSKPEVPVQVEPSPGPEPVPELDSAPELTPEPESEETTSEAESDPKPVIVTSESPELEKLPEEVVPPVAQSTEYPAAVLALTPSELKQAAKLYTSKNQAEFSKLGVAKRQADRQQKLDAILNLLTTEGEKSLPQISKKLYITPGTTSHYLQLLIQQGFITASGWQSARRYKKV